jgi:hypothetical protein
MPVDQILLSAATVSAVLAPVASVPAQNRLIVSVTVISPCSISAQGLTSHSTQPEIASVACASSQQSFVSAEDRARPIVPVGPHPREGVATQTSLEDNIKIIQVTF